MRETRIINNSNRAQSIIVLNSDGEATPMGIPANSHLDIDGESLLTSQKELESRRLTSVVLNPVVEPAPQPAHVAQVIPAPAPEPKKKNEQKEQQSAEQG